MSAQQVTSSPFFPLVQADRSKGLWQMRKETDQPQFPSVLQQYSDKVEEEIEEALDTLIGQALALRSCWRSLVEHPSVGVRSHLGTGERQAVSALGFWEMVNLTQITSDQLKILEGFWKGLQDILLITSKNS
jgi:hypothetical protein